jgi:hypothetical protein
MLVDVDDELSDIILVYPNPALDIIYIDGITDRDIHISTVDGRSSSHSITNGQVDISAFVKGIYLLSLEVDDRIYSRTFVKM